MPISLIQRASGCMYLLKAACLKVLPQSPSPASLSRSFSSCSAATRLLLTARRQSRTMAPEVHTDNQTQIISTRHTHRHTHTHTHTHTHKPSAVGSDTGALLATVSCESTSTDTRLFRCWNAVPGQPGTWTSHPTLKYKNKTKQIKLKLKRQRMKDITKSDKPCTTSLYILCGEVTQNQTQAKTGGKTFLISLAANEHQCCRWHQQGR